MNSESTPKCPQCGAPLPPDAPDGLCPLCVMALNLKTETIFSSEPTPTQPPLSPEQLAPHFPQLEILEYLGRGGMGVVYKARQKTLNRIVALKLLAPERVHDPEFASRFTREAQALAALNHPNIVTIHDFGQAGGFYFLLMEYVDGVNLRHLLRARKFTPEEALTIVPPLCDALQYAHERGIVHRDIKPENILLDKGGRVKVADFGIAKMLANGHEATGTAASGDNVTRNAMGTPGYSAPEQQADPRRVDSRADIYSLGVVFYEMLTGELPGKRIEPPSKKVHIDVRLDEIVLRALEQKPELRYQQASVLKTQVETISQTPPGNAAVPSAAPAPEALWREKKLIIFATAIFVAGFLVCLFFALEYPRQAAAPLAVMTMSVFGLVVCGLRFAGHWPFASLLFPRPNFSSRNLKRGQHPPAAPTISEIKCPVTMERWLAMMDTGEYAESWGVAAPYFQKQVSKDEWVQRLQKARRPLGEILSRKVVSIENTVFGSRYEAKYASSFEGLFAATETVTYAKQGNGEWLPIGYLVRPAEASQTLVKRPWPLVAVAGLCIISGFPSVWSVGKSIAQGAFPAGLDTGLLSLLVGVGLLRLRPWWRKTAIFLLLLSVMIIVVAGLLALSGVKVPAPHGAMIFGYWVKNEILGGVINVGMLILALWQYLVLVRPDVKALFNKRGFDRPLIEWAALLGAVAVSAGLVWATQPAENGLSSDNSIASNPATERLVSDPPFVAEFGNGGRIELLAVRSNADTNQPWWQLNGAPSGFGKEIQPASQPQHTKGVAAIIRMEEPKDLDNWPRANGVWGEGVHAKNGIEGFGASNQRLPNDLLAVYFDDASTVDDTTTLHLTIAGGQWQWLRSAKPGIRNSLTRIASDDVWSFSEAVGGDLKAANPHVVENPNLEYRLTAVDTDGKLYLPTETYRRPGATFTAYDQVIFTRLPLKYVREVRWEARPYETIEFRNVSLKPGHRTAVRIKDFSVGRETPLPIRNLSFGPVVERTLSDAQSADQPGFLKLESGQRLTRSEIFGTNRLTSGFRIAFTESGAASALESRGVEMGGNVNSDTPGLYVWNCSTYAIGASGWAASEEPDKKQPGWNKSLQDIFNGLPAPISGTCNMLSGEPAQTWLLKTKHGEQVVLQITGFTENPRGVRIRYKLVQSESANFQPAQTGAAEIAAAIRRQEAADAPATFDFRFSNSGETVTATGPIKKVLSFRMTKHGSRVTNLIFRLPPDVTCQTSPSENITENGIPMDRYSVTFTFERTGLPATNLQFSIAFLDKNDQSVQKTFRMVYHPDFKSGPPPFPYEISEVLPATDAAAATARLNYQWYRPDTNPPTTQNLFFGPVVERLVTDSIDFDSGALKSFPLSSHKAGSDWEWFKMGEAEGIDATYETGKFLFVVAMDAIPVADKEWDSTSPPQLEAELADRIDPANLQLKMEGTKLPATFGFRTHAGSTGLLQIVAFTENPGGVKIRYKLVQPKNAATHVYTIERDDTALIIARRFGMTIAELKALNQDLNWNRLRVGQKARVFGEEPVGKEAESAAIAKDSARHDFQFRWVAVAGDSNAPADILREIEGRKFAVLKPVVLTSDDVESAGFSQYQSEQKTLEVFLTDQGREKFAQATAQNIGRQLAIVWRGKVLSAPVVQSQIPGGRVAITGRFSDAEAQELLDVLNHRAQNHTASRPPVYHDSNPLQEPSYQGKTLLEWLGSINCRSNLPNTLEQPREAIRQMGTNVIAFLLADLGNANSLHVKYSRQDFRSGDDRSCQAVWAFDALGAEGKSAIPELEKLLPSNPGYVPGALAGIGRDALPVLLRALTNEDFWVRDNTAAYLANAINSGKFSGHEAIAALPIAERNLSYTNSTNNLYEANTRSRAKALFEAIRKDPSLKKLSE